MHLHLLEMCVLIALVHGRIVHSIAQKKRQLYIGGMLPLSHNSSTKGLNGSELLSVCKLAVDMINNNTHILPNYDLNLLFNDTQCNEGTGTRVLFEYLSRRPPVIMLLGAGCSSVSRTVAQAAWQWNLIQVSYGSTASYLSNTKRYKLFYRVIPPDSSRIAALISFLKLNKWNRVALVGENDMGQTIIELTQELHKHNATIITSEILTEEPSKQMENIKAKDARIIISLVNQDRTKHVFCQAYQVGIYGRRYVWIFPFWFGDQWWLKDGSHCNKHQLNPPAHENFFFDSTGLATSDKDAFGMSALQMKETLKKDPGFTNDFALFAFDAMWAMALTLHNAAKTLAEQNKTLEMFNYRSSRITAIMKSSLQSISFQGTTGHVKFDSNGDRIVPIRIRLLQGGSLVTAAVYHPDSNRLLHNDSLLWQGSPPLDGQRFVYNTMSMPWPLFWFIIAMTSCAILLSLLFLVFNVVYRANSFIKLSSPNINHVVIIGAILIYTSVLVFILDSRVVNSTTLPSLCSVTVYFLGIGYSLFLGAMFSKTWRVYQILNKVYMKKKVFNESQLTGVVAAFVAIDVFLFTLWTVLDPFVLSRETAKKSILEDSTTLVYQYEHCNSKYMTTWLYVILGYKVLILLVGCFIAVVTRKVKARALNDSQLIGSSIYVITASALMGLPLVFLIPDKNAVVAVLCFALLLPTTISLCIIFIPKMFMIRKHSQEPIPLKSLSVMRNTNDINIQSRDFSGRDANAKEDRKALHNTSLEAEDFDGYNDSVASTPQSARKHFTLRSNTFQDLSESPKQRPGNQHRRYNTISVPSKQTTLNPRPKLDDNHHIDLKVENASLRRKLHHTKITEAGKMCKVLYENAELNRKLVEVSMTQNQDHDITDTVSRLMKENNELKRQLGEVSILNSAATDTTPRMKRKGMEHNKRDLKELQHLLEVDLGGGRASSLRSNNKRPPTIGLSQSSLNLLDTKETRHDIAGDSNSEKCEKIGNLNNNEENTKSVENIESTDILLNPSNDNKTEEIMEATTRNENKDIKENEPIGEQDNHGFLEDSTTADQGSDDSHELANSESITLDKLMFDEYAKSKTKELLEKGSVHINPPFDNPTFEGEKEDVRKSENGRNLSENVTKHDLSESKETRTVIGCDDSEAKKSYQSPSVIETNNSDEKTGEEGCGIVRKQRKSKRDKKTKIEKVEKTFFV